MSGSKVWIIGSASHCDLVVPQATVSGRHCSLLHDGRQWALEDLGSTNGTFVDGRPLTPGRPVPVSRASIVTLGKTTPMPWPSIAAPEPAHTSAKRDIRIGRGPDNDVVLDFPMVSWEHARIVEEAGATYIEDLNSRNGVALNQVANRVRRARIHPQDEVYLGSYKISAGKLLGSRKTSIGEASRQQVTFSGKELLIGRDPQCDQPLKYPMISWHHARLTRTPEGIVVDDLNSRNGTFVNGARITTRTLIRAGDEIGLGSFRFQLQSGDSLFRRDYHGNVTIEADGVSITAKKRKVLIETVSLTIYPSELVALMGPSGAGKTTLLKALNGYTRPASGKVLFNGKDLYEHYDQFRLLMGYVPQDDIVHGQLEVGEALYFSLKLRTDLSDSEIHTRIDKVLRDLNLLEKKDTPIGSPENKSLSGGQRKRVNIALELIHDTPVLFLDEPTSGLSSKDAEDIVTLLKRLSREGKTIITTIHQPSLEAFQQFDDVIMLTCDKDKPGALAFFGPAYPDSIEFFNDKPATTARPQMLTPEMLLSGLDKHPRARWEQSFRNSPYWKQFVSDRAGTQPEKTGQPHSTKPPKPIDFRQWLALTHRAALCRWRDKLQSAILLLQAPLFAILVVAVNAPLDTAHFEKLVRKLVIIHFLMVVAAIWFGCNNAARDIVGEWMIYQRERMVALKLPSYLFSKLAILLAICAFQCYVMLAIVYLGCGLRGDFLLQFGVLLLASMVGGIIGLCISSRVSSTESAIALLPVVLLPVIALGGGLQPTYLLGHAMQTLTSVVPSRWAFEANVVNEGGPKPGGKPNENRWGFNQQPIGDPRTLAESNPANHVPPANTGSAPVRRTPQTGSPESFGDAAEASVPRYILWKTDDDHPTRDALQTEHGRQEFRKPVWFYLSALSTMFVILVLMALGFLWMRDIN